jgi:hypothetical protein
LNQAIGHQNKTPLGIAERGFAGVLKLRADMKFAPDQDWSSLDPDSQANSVSAVFLREKVAVLPEHGPAGNNR